VTDLRLDDWTSGTIPTFTKELEIIKKSVIDFDRLSQNESKKTSEKSNIYKLSFTGEDGIETIKTFDKATYSDRGKLLYNEIANAIDEMGRSITEQEKRQILMELLEKLC